MAKSRQLKSNYQKYLHTPDRQSRMWEHFWAFMPEMVFRTFKLEGEPVTRSMVKAIFTQ